MLTSNEDAAMLARSLGSRPGCRGRLTRWIALTAIYVTSVASAQVSLHPPTGHLRGTILDESGGIIPSARVIFKSDQAMYTATASAVGAYEIELPAGVYEINVVKPGFCYRRASFRMASASLTINAHVPICAIAQVTTIADGESSVRDEWKPSTSTDEFAIPGQENRRLKLFISYDNRREDADVTTYSGSAFLANAARNVVVTYDSLTISAKRVRFDRRASRLYAEDGVTIEDGKQSSTSDHAEVKFENGKFVTQFN